MMKTTLLLDLHTKSLQALDLIARAESRQKALAEWCARYDATTWQNELKLWGMGKPSAKWAQEQSHNLEITTMALRRLIRYYKKVVLKITTFATETELEAVN